MPFLRFNVVRDLLSFFSCKIYVRQIDFFWWMDLLVVVHVLSCQQTNKQTNLQTFKETEMGQNITSLAEVNMYFDGHSSGQG